MGKLRRFVHETGNRFYRCWRQVNWLFFANIFFLLGAIMWLASPIMCLEGDRMYWADPPKEELSEYYYWVCGTLGTVASSLYLVDALLYFGDWLVLNRMGVDSVYEQRQFRATSFIQRVDFYLISCLFFLLGIIADFVTAHYGGLSDDDYVAAYEYAWYSGSMIFWCIYAVSEIIRNALDQRNREALDAPVRFYLFPWFKKCHKLGPNVQHILFAWDMMGSILFLIASLLYLFSANLWFFFQIDDCPDCYYFEIVAASLFVLNALCLLVNQAHLRYLAKGRIFYVATDLETTRDYEPTKEAEISNDAEDFQSAATLAGAGSSATIAPLPSNPPTDTTPLIGTTTTTRPAPPRIK